MKCLGVSAVSEVLRFGGRVPVVTETESDYADELFWKIIGRFTLIQASTDQGVPRARVAELLAGAQVLVQDLGSDKSAGDLLTVSRELLSLYRERNLTDARPRLDEIRRRYAKPPSRLADPP